MKGWGYAGLAFGPIYQGAMLVHDMLLYCSLGFSRFLVGLGVGCPYLTLRLRVDQYFLRPPVLTKGSFSHVGDIILLVVSPMVTPCKGPFDQPSFGSKRQNMKENQPKGFLN